MTNRAADQGRAFFAACGATPPIPLLWSVPGQDEVKCALAARPFLLVGRSQRCDLQVRSPRVRLCHAYVQVVRGRLASIDLHAHSTAGSRGPRRRLSRWIDPGDALSVGPLSIRRPDAQAASDGRRRPEPTATPPAPEEPGEPSRVPPVRLKFLNARKSNAADPARHWPVQQDLTLIGASPNCQIQLTVPDGGVSRVHCSLVLTPGGLWIVDLLADGGTWVDGDRIRYSFLEDHSEVRIGPFRLGIRYGAAAAGPRVLRRRTRAEDGPAADGVIENAASSGGPLVPAAPDATVPQAPPETHGPPAAGGFSEDFVLSLIEQFTAMQQQMFAQTQQQMMALMQMFCAMQDRQQDRMHEEFRRLQEINRELQQVQRDLLRERAAPALPPPAASPDSDVSERSRGSRPRHPSRAEAVPDETAASAPRGREGDMHGWLIERMGELERERDSRWQRIMRAVIGQGGQEP